DDVDPFGNVITSLMGNEFVKSAINEGDELEVSVNDNEPFTTRFHYSFNDTNVGDSLIYPNFNNVIGLSVNRGSFAEKYGVKENDTITIRKVNSHE
ncbi:MAG: SAM-dependent chlorinase/fluorinase, partial [Erysipelotrichaceae bacterium]|nr:SAM-dependent chlorinase/fluorinase [Erysipelotrichaceae bacterium]